MTRGIWVAVGAALLVPLLLVITIAGIGQNPARGLGDELADALLNPKAPIPAEYVEWVIKAGATCPELSPPLIAAQIDLESSWNPRAYTDVGQVPAMGIAQFTADTWTSWGGDFDRDGDATPYDPQDAIIAQGRLMCDLVSWAAVGVRAGKLKGDVYDLAFAAYFAGRQGILDVGGVPATGLAHDYPQQLRSRLPKYAKIQAAAVVGNAAFPLPRGSYEVGSGYGPRGGGYHHGVDIMVPIGTPIFAVLDGTVVYAECNSPYCDRPGSSSLSGCGWMVEIQHADKTQSWYCHAVRLNVHQGQKVKAGQVIAVSGSTGNSSGPHLHFESRDAAGNSRDPLPWLASLGVPA